MPAEIISEFACKKLFFSLNGYDEHILKLNKPINEITQLPFLKNPLVCKVDERIKHRKKHNLVYIKHDLNECLNWIALQPYNSFIIEPYYEIVQELYLLIRFTNDSDEIYFSSSGGIDFSDLETCSNSLISPLEKYINFTDLNITDSNLKKIITELYEFYNEYHLTFMEINPLARLADGSYLPLDFAVKYDTTSKYKFNQEVLSIIDNGISSEIKELDSNSGASFKFNLINPNGSIWLMVAGGGASVLYADALVEYGQFNEMANYGEYSGNPTSTEVYKYASHIIKKMFESCNDKPFILIIGGGISNFTDVEKTFSGICKAIEENASQFISRNVKIYVRRGGLNYVNGLASIRTLCEYLGIACEAYGPDVHITGFMDNIFKNKVKIKGSTYHYDVEPLHTKKFTYNKCLSVFNKFSKIVVVNMQTEVIQRILDFDFVVGKQDPSVVGIIYPSKAGSFATLFFGKTEIFIPIYNSIEDAEKQQPVDIVINYASFRSAFNTTMQLMDSSVKFIAIIAEGMAESDARILSLISKKRKKMILGPATVGAISAGSIRIGSTCGSMDNIIQLKLYQTGNISLVTRSGGLLNEMCNIIYQSGGRVNEAVAIGGDRYPCSTFLDHVIRFQNDPAIDLICLLGEVGGMLEIDVANAYRNKVITKPIIAWVMGTSLKMFGSDMQFGHAGSYADHEHETAFFKNYYLKCAGIMVPDSFEDIQDLIKNYFVKLEFKYPTTVPLTLPTDLENLAKNYNVRKHADFYTSISNEVNGIMKYNNKSVGEIIKKPSSIGHTIGLLLFKLEFPDYLAHFIEFVVVNLADHTIAVSSAHNTAVCARSGQNISASVASGLLCIHDKHGGAIQNAAISFYKAFYIKKHSPNEYVLKMNTKNKYIPGIGHLNNNSTNNKDSRLEYLYEFVTSEFPNYDLLTYVKEIETITLRKKDNLILNIDGFIAAAFISAIVFHFGNKAMQDIIENDCLNSLFIIARTIGLCATYTDQKRLRQPLHRQPLSTISFIS